MNTTRFRGIFSPTAAALISATLVASLISDRAMADASDASDTAATQMNYALVGIANVEGVSYACVTDKLTGHHFVLSTDTKSELGINLISITNDSDSSAPAAIIQTANESVLIKKGADSSPIEIAVPAIKPSAQQVAAPGGAPPSTLADNLKPPPGARLPLVFQEVDAKKLGFTDDQIAILGRLRQNFVDDLKSPDANATAGDTENSTEAATSSTSAYDKQQLQNWRKAQNESDDLFRLQFGTQAFNAYQESASYPVVPGK